MKKYYSLNEFLETMPPEEYVIDHIISCKHNYLLIKQEEYECLVSTEEYVTNSFSYDGTCNYSLIIKHNNKMYEMNSIIEIIGFNDYETALLFCDDETDCLCGRPDSKLIFSPQLAKFLVRHGFRVIDFKQKAWI